MRDWALAQGYTYLPAEPDDKPDQNLDLKISVPDKIKALPWRVKIEIRPPEEIAEVQLFLDNFFLASNNSGVWEYTGNLSRVDGRHQFTVVGRTKNNKTSQKIVVTEFSLGEKLVLIAPQDTQQLNFPTNVVLESNIDLAAENVQFFAQTATGKDLAIMGKTAKQQLGQVFYYTLNWAETEKPPAGSYAIYGRIGAQTSNQVTVKIP
mgnify:FL=1